MVWVDNYSTDGVKTLWWGLKCEIKALLGLVHSCRCENLSNFGIFEMIWGLGLAIFGCGGIEIIGFGLVCGFVMLKYMGGFAVVQGGKVSAP